MSQLRGLFSNLLSSFGSLRLGCVGSVLAFACLPTFSIAYAGEDACQNASRAHQDYVYEGSSGRTYLAGILDDYDRCLVGDIGSWDAKHLRIGIDQSRAIVLSKDYLAAYELLSEIMDETERRNEVVGLTYFRAKLERQRVAYKIVNRKGKFQESLRNRVEKETAVMGKDGKPSNDVLKYFEEFPNRYSNSLAWAQLYDHRLYVDINAEVFKLESLLKALDSDSSAAVESVYSVERWVHLYLTGGEVVEKGLETGDISMNTLTNLVDRCGYEESELAEIGTRKDLTEIDVSRTCRATIYRKGLVSKVYSPQSMQKLKKQIQERVLKEGGSYDDLDISLEDSVEYWGTRYFRSLLGLLEADIKEQGLFDDYIDSEMRLSSLLLFGSPESKKLILLMLNENLSKLGEGELSYPRLNDLHSQFENANDIESLSPSKENLLISDVLLLLHDDAIWSNFAPEDMNGKNLTNLYSLRKAGIVGAGSMYHWAINSSSESEARLWILRGDKMLMKYGISVGDDYTELLSTAAREGKGKGKDKDKQGLALYVSTLALRHQTTNKGKDQSEFKMVLEESVDSVHSLFEGVDPSFMKIDSSSL